MQQAPHRHGFTLIELLVVIAIIAILAAILFPVFARAREKARQTTCSSNQRQIVASIQMYVQDHDETFPQASTVWSDINVDAGVLICPTAGKSVSNAYVYASDISGMAMGKITDPTAQLVTADGSHTATTAPLTYANVGYSYGDYSTRHGWQWIGTSADGHVSMTRITNGPQFINATSVNVLERWNIGGGYYWGNSLSCAGNPVMCEDFPSGGESGTINVSGAGSPVGGTSGALNPFWVKYTFTSPLNLGRVGVAYRNGESPNNASFSDQGGTIASANCASDPASWQVNYGAANAYYNGSRQTYACSSSGHASNFVQLNVSPTCTNNGNLEPDRIYACVAGGESLIMDGTYNIFYDEGFQPSGSSRMTVVSNVGASNTWVTPTMVGNGVKPAGTGGNLTLKLSRPYTFTGSFITMIDTSRVLATPAIDISTDGSTWTNVWTSPNTAGASPNFGFQFSSSAPYGYITLTPPSTNPTMTAQWVRLTFGPNTNTGELQQWQLFGY